MGNLVITRRINESFELSFDKSIDPNTPIKDVILDNITVTLGGISQGQVRLLIKADSNINIKRSEIKDE